MAVTLTGTNFVVGATTVAVAGGGVTVTNLIVGSTTSLTASFVLDLAAAAGPRTVTVTTAGGTSGAQTFTINLPAPGSTTFNYTGGEQTFVVPAGVVSVTILATGARAVLGLGLRRHGWPGRSDDGDRVRHAGRVAHRACRGRPVVGSVAVGGFNGGGASTGVGGGAAAALRVCVTAPPRWWSWAAEGAGALHPEAAATAETAPVAVVSGRSWRDPVQWRRRGRGRHADRWRCRRR